MGQWPVTYAPCCGCELCSMRLPEAPEMPRRHATKQWPITYAARCRGGLCSMRLPDGPEVQRLPRRSGLSRTRPVAVAASAIASRRLPKCHACHAAAACHVCGPLRLRPLHACMRRFGAAEVPLLPRQSARSPCKSFLWVVRKPRRRRRRRRGAREYMAPRGTGLYENEDPTSNGLGIDNKNQ